MHQFLSYGLILHLVNLILLEKSAASTIFYEQPAVSGAKFVEFKDPPSQSVQKQIEFEVILNSVKQLNTDIKLQTAILENYIQLSLF